MVYVRKTQVGVVSLAVSQDKAEKYQENQQLQRIMHQSLGVLHWIFDEISVVLKSSPFWYFQASFGAANTKNLQWNCWHVVFLLYFPTLWTLRRFGWLDFCGLLIKLNLTSECFGACQAQIKRSKAGRVKQPMKAPSWLQREGCHHAGWDLLCTAAPDLLECHLKELL